MTRFTTTNCTGLIIEVWDWPTDISLEDNEFKYTILDEQGMPYDVVRRKLPPGQWTLLGLSKELTEQECHNLIEGREEYKGIWVYKGYVNGSALPTATESFNSLLTSLGLTDKNYAIVLNDKK